MPRTVEIWTATLFYFLFGDGSLKCSSIGVSSFLPKNLVAGTVVAVLKSFRGGKTGIDRPCECTTFQEGNTAQAKRTDY